jgi:rhodanese-related sulfurtransferase
MQVITLDKLLQKYPQEVLLAQKDIVIIDVREADEYEHEHIPGAQNIPLNQLDRLTREDFHDKTVIFHCRSGHRTEINQALLDKTPFQHKYCLAGGLTAWKAAKLPLQKNSKAPIDVMRQVQFIVSMMILLGIGLSYVVSPYFILLTVFAGLGLLVASLTGFCGMASLLKFMPWNKLRSAP